jgi:DNA repair ATPase RecN
MVADISSKETSPSKCVASDSISACFAIQTNTEQLVKEKQNGDRLDERLRKDTSEFDDMKKKLQLLSDVETQVEKLQNMQGKLTDRKTSLIKLQTSKKAYDTLLSSLSATQSKYRKKNGRISKIRHFLMDRQVF